MYSASEGLYFSSVVVTGLAVFAVVVVASVDVITVVTVFGLVVS